jgi:hypothetical protein
MAGEKRVKIKIKRPHDIGRLNAGVNMKMLAGGFASQKLGP